MVIQATCISRPFRDSCIFPIHRHPVVTSQVNPLAKIRRNEISQRTDFRQDVKRNLALILKVA